MRFQNSMQKQKDQILKISIMFSYVDTCDYSIKVDSAVYLSV